MRKSFFKIYFKLIIFCIIIGYAQTLIKIYIASNLGKILNKSLNKDIFGLKNEVVVLVISLIIFYILKYFVEYISEVQKQKSRENYIIKIYEKFLISSYRYVEKFNFGHIMTRFTSDIDNVITTYSETNILIVVSLLSFLTYFIYLCNINFLLTVICVILGILSIIPPLILKDRFQINFQTYQELEEKIHSHLNTTVEGYESLKLHNLYNLFESSINKIFKIISDCALDFEKVRAFEGVLNSGVKNITKYSIYALSAYFIFKDRVTVSSGFQYIMLYTALTDCIGSIMSTYRNFQKGKLSLDRIDELLATEEKDGEIQINCIGKLELKDVMFSFENNCVIKKLNLTISKGDKILVKGPNGSGKTTLIKLILGIYDNFAGEILINSIDIRNINKKVYREKIAFLPQNQFFISDDIYENINIFSENPLHMNELIKNFKLASENLESARCSKFSGGQRQKLTLIRTLMKESELIILDEPTNYLDDDSMQVLLKELTKANKTLLVISHDPKIENIFENSVEMCDLIYVDKLEEVV